MRVPLLGEPMTWTPPPKTPPRKALCPYCKKILSAYVPSAWVERIDGPRRYIFRSHQGPAFGSSGTHTCPGWATRVPDDAFMDGQPNIDGRVTDEG